MAIYFFDSRAIVKRYLMETGTAWVSSITDLANGNIIYLAGIAFVEVISAIARKAHSRGLSSNDATKAIADFRADFTNEYLVIELTPTLIESAAGLAETTLAGSASISLVPADGPLNSAAVVEGLAVDDPNLHP